MEGGELVPGTVHLTNNLYVLDRARPTGSAPDIGALEYGASQTECIRRFPADSTR